VKIATYNIGIHRVGVLHANHDFSDVCPRQQLNVSLRLDLSTEAQKAVDALRVKER